MKKIQVILLAFALLISSFAISYAGEVEESIDKEPIFDMETFTPIVGEEAEKVGLKSDIFNISAVSSNLNITTTGTVSESRWQDVLNSYIGANDYSLKYAHENWQEIFLRMTKLTLNKLSNDNLENNKESKDIMQIDKLTRIPKEFYEGTIVVSKLPQNCTFALNNHYGIAVEKVEINKTSTKQFPEFKTTVYLLDFKLNSRTLLAKYDNYYSASEFCIAGDNIYFIETHIDKATKNSGEWAIKEYNIPTKTFNIIDSGRHENFNLYKYPILILVIKKAYSLHI